MKKTAFITGITGQDGPYLAQFLLSKNYRVIGLVKRYSNLNLENLKFLNIHDQVELITGDITDENSINHVIKSMRPNEFYNLAAQSFVGVSWELNKLTTEVNAIGVLNILNAIKVHSPVTRFYQASTSEMYGNSDTPIQNETTAFKPRSPYGVSKLYSHWITINFRESYGLHASNGILFNHESPLRGIEFVTRKITDGVARIKLGLKDKITLGNLDVSRDWGFAGDYVEAMWMMLQHAVPEEFVISSGEKHTIKEFLNLSFAAVGINDWEKYIDIDPRFKRPAEISSLFGDNSKARRVLGWAPKTSFTQLVDSMIKADLDRVQKLLQNE